MGNKEDILKQAKRLRKELIPHIGATSLEILDGIIQEVVKLRKQIPKDNRNMKSVESKFDIVWAEYPEKKGKHDAWLKFKNQVKTPQDFTNICVALQNYKADMAKVRQVHPERPWLHGSTWFNHRWEDFIDYQAPAKLQAPAQQSQKFEAPKPEECVDPAELQKMVKKFNRGLKSVPRASNKFVEPLK